MSSLPHPAHLSLPRAPPSQDPPIAWYPTALGVSTSLTLWCLLPLPTLLTVSLPFPGHTSLWVTLLPSLPICLSVCLTLLHCCLAFVLSVDLSLTLSLFIPLCFWLSVTVSLLVFLSL